MKGLMNISPIFIVLLMALSCKKKDNTPAPVITAISPDNGPFSTIVTISGNNFSADPANDIVKFNGVTAQVQSATATALQVEVAAGSGTGPVSVAVGAQTVTGPVFNYVPTITVSTLAGNGMPGFADGAAQNAEFDFPIGVAVDTLSNIIYVADYFNNRIRIVSSSGDVSTPAGNGTAGFADGTASNAEFNYPAGIAVDGQGNIYVADQENNRIRKVSPSGVVSTLAGDGTAGFADGTASNAEFNYPAGIAVDGQGNMYVADQDNHRIRKVTSSGVVSTLAGNGVKGFADGAGAAAEFFFPVGVAVDGQGNVYVADAYNCRIRKVSPSGVVSTLAGNGAVGFADGTASDAEFYYPAGVALDGQGNVYVADEGNNRIRKVTSSGVVSTLAGNGVKGFADGAGATAEFSGPYGVGLDRLGNAYVVDFANNRVRKITVQ